MSFIPVLIMSVVFLGGCVQTQTWQNASILETSAMPPQFYAWISDLQSMTARMEQVCGKVEVHVVANQFDTVTVEESQYLPNDHSDRAWVREVIMTCDQVPWLFGRTVIPLDGTKVSLPALTRLKNKPLGKVLFADPTTRRSAFEYAHLNAGHYYIQRIQGYFTLSPQPLWGRRSLLHYQGKPLLLTEIFLPEMLNAISKNVS